ncbi:MAG: hypothetical protein ACE5OZ_04410 [Candidatus Heimdallarchaeota archaeon]
MLKMATGLEVRAQRLKNLLFAENFMLDLALRYAKALKRKDEWWIWSNFARLLAADDRQRVRMFFSEQSPLFSSLRHQLRYKVHEKELRCLGEDLGGWLRTWMIVLLHGFIMAKQRRLCSS